MAEFSYSPLDRSETLNESFEKINTNFESIDETMIDISANMSDLAGAIQTVDQRTIRLKIHPAVVSTAGQTTFTVPEQYQTGRLIVYSGGLQMVAGVHWTEVNDTTIQFTEPRVAGERVQILEYQLGSDDGLPMIIGTTSIFTSTEEASGVVDSTDGFDGNGVFTLSHYIEPGTVPSVRISGSITLTPYTQFTWVDEGNTITIVNGYKPVAPEYVQVEYQWRT